MPTGHLLRPLLAVMVRSLRPLLLPQRLLVQLHPHLLQLLKDLLLLR